MDENLPALTDKTNRKSKKQLLLTTLLAAILIVLCCSGTYYWQHGKLVRVNNQVASVIKQNEVLKSKNSSLQKQYSQAKATIENYQAKAVDSPQAMGVATQADLALTIDGAQYVNPGGAVTEGSKWFGVNMTLINNTSETISIRDADFHLKDTQNNTYPEETIQGASTLPAGWMPLPNKTIAPGETVKGSVIFQMPSTNIKNFNFISVTKSYSVTSSN